MTVTVTCKRCGNKYDCFDNRASVMRCNVYLARTDRYVIMNGLELCPECTKSLLTWFGNGFNVEDNSFITLLGREEDAE